MRPNRTTAPLLALVGLALGAAGCKPSDSILLVEVAGPSALVPFQFSVTVLAGLDGRNFLVPPAPPPGGASISLPASFTIALDRARMGPITISIDALDANGSPIGFGTAMQQHFQIGGQTSISVMLVGQLPPDTGDAGADGPADANSTTDADDASGADGVASDGAAGQDGSSSADGRDAPGLDGAAD